jgi:hypothetical protein
MAEGWPGGISGRLSGMVAWPGRGALAAGLQRCQAAASVAGGTTVCPALASAASAKPGRPGELLPTPRALTPPSTSHTRLPCILTPVSTHTHTLTAHSTPRDLPPQGMGAEAGRRYTRTMNSCVALSTPLELVFSLKLDDAPPPGLTGAPRAAAALLCCSCSCCSCCMARACVHALAQHPAL